VTPIVMAPAMVVLIVTNLNDVTSAMELAIFQKNIIKNCNMKSEGLTSEEYEEWVNVLSDNPPEPYEQSESFNKYWLRKWNHYEKLAKKFLKSKGKKHF
jgi:hypothetical protein